jgi:hypothetical protein
MSLRSDLYVELGEVPPCLLTLSISVIIVVIDSGLDNRLSIGLDRLIRNAPPL